MQNLFIKPHSGLRLLDKREKIGLLKLDIEGGEFDLLKRYETLKKIPVVFAELHDRIITGVKKCTLSSLKVEY